MMPKRRLLIIGAGGFGREVLQWAQDIQSQTDVDWEVGGFLDGNANALSGFKIDVPVVGDPVTYMPKPTDCLVCAIGEPATRLRICRKLQSRGAEFVTLIHPTAYLGARCDIGVGSILCPGVVVTVDVSIGDFSILNLNVGIGHDVRIGHGCTINSFCDITGAATLGDRVFLGSHAVITPAAKVGDDAKVGAGSVVVRRVRANTTVMGPTAKRIDWTDDPSASSEAA
jgi:sugar O-acyltransferase (sialic acid O-acetyltransferase NeuD family)